MSNLCNVLSTVLLLSFKPKERLLSLKLARGCGICAPDMAYTTVLLPRYLCARRGVHYRAAATALCSSSLLYYVLCSSPNYWTPSILTIFMLCTYIYARDSPQFTPLAPGGIKHTKAWDPSCVRGVSRLGTLPTLQFHLPHCAHVRGRVFS